jgi:hypothetical protein
MFRNKSNETFIRHCATTTTTNMKCIKCGYEWLSKSRMPYATCPACLRKTKNNEVAVVQGIAVETKLINLRATYEKWVEEMKTDWNTEMDGELVIPSYEEWLSMTK